eukprot:42229_1
MKDPCIPSLIHPDFNGLWSVARLGHQKKWWSDLMGTFVVILFLSSWVGGCCVPFLLISLYLAEYYTSFIIILSMIIIPYLLTMSPQYPICRFYLTYGAHYWDGGTSVSFESEPIFTNNHNSTIPICVSYHPHGIFSLAFFFACGIRFRAIEDLKNEKLRRKFAGKISDANYKNTLKRIPRKGIIAPVLNQLPVFNLVAVKFTDCATSASKRNVNAFMKKKLSFALLAGGFEEATMCNKGEDAIYIRQRKGFIKYCLQYGYEIVPAYNFGECELYHNMLYTKHDTWLTRIKLFLNDWKIPTVFPVGPYWSCPLLPYKNTGLHSILSGNSRYEHIENPTQKEIDDVHKWYVNEVIALFGRHKWRFGYGKNVKLKLHGAVE